MIKCEKGTVTIIGKANDAIAEWAALTAHMVTVLEQEGKETGEVTTEEAIEIVEKKFKECFKRSLIVAEVVSGDKLYVGLDLTTEEIVDLMKEAWKRNN